MRPALRTSEYRPRGLGPRSPAASERDTRAGSRLATATLARALRIGFLASFAFVAFLATTRSAMAQDGARSTIGDQAPEAAPDAGIAPGADAGRPGPEGPAARLDAPADGDGGAVLPAAQNDAGPGAPAPVEPSGGGAAPEEPQAPTDAAAPTAPTTSAAPPAASGLETVVVTARYRPEDAQDVPIPITNITSDQLKALAGTATLKQIMQQIPSLNIQGYSGRNQTITIRALGTNAGGTNDGLEQGVGLYIDGVYRPRTGSAITDLVDIESIQVLRGPQGTLFGKNTVAGAVDIRTPEPAFKQIIDAEASYGNYNLFRAYLSVTEPLTDSLTLRASYLRTSRDGWIYNTTFHDNWDNLNNDAVRLDVLYKPNDRFKTRLIADYSMQACNCGFQSVAQVLPTTLANGKVVTGFYQHAAAVGYSPIPVDPFARQTDINSSQADKMPSWGLQNRADWRTGGDLTLTSITAYRNWKWLPNFDGDQFGANISPEGIVQTFQQQASQELRLASPGGEKIDYTLGLYYFWQQANDYQYSSYGTQAAGWLVSPTTPSAVLDNVVAFSHVVPATSSYAGYGQATYNPTSHWHLTGGLRFTYEHKTGSYDAYAAGGDPSSMYASGVVTPIADLPAASQAGAATTRNSLAPNGHYAQSLDVNNLSWTAVAAHDFTEDLHAFVSYSRGYKSPGINLVRQSLGVNVFVQPETVDDFEVGAKLAFFGGRLELNPNLFYAIDQNYQANYVNTGVVPQAVYVTNVGTVVSRGVELDARVNPVQGLNGSFSMLYNDAQYQSYTNAPAQFLHSYLVTQDLSGQQVSGAPRWSLGAAAEYTAPVLVATEGGRSVDVYVGADWSYRSSFYAAVNLDPFSQVHGYQLLGLHAGVREARRWDVSVWMRNVFDENYFNTISVNATYGITLASLGDPRTFGATVRGEF
jgi:iron complex outermembrane recepter protein